MTLAAFPGGFHGIGPTRTWLAHERSSLECEWANPEGDDDKVKKIEAVTREWVMQKMIEAVQGLRQLENGRTWITKTYDDALSPVALTAAFMADRYHTLAEVKRAAGALRQGRRAAAAAGEVS